MFVMYCVTWLEKCLNISAKISKITDKLLKVILNHAVKGDYLAVDIVQCFNL